MKTVLCYYSYHHGNTRKVAEAMAAAGDVTLLDVRITPTADLSGYDCVGLASGIYGFEVHKALVDFARANLPAGKPVFFVTTYGAAKGAGAKALAAVAAEKACPVLGEFGCKGFGTFGRLRWWAASPKATPTRRTWRMRAHFTKPSRLPAAGTPNKCRRPPMRAAGGGTGGGNCRGQGLCLALYQFARARPRSRQRPRASSSGVSLTIRPLSS